MDFFRNSKSGRFIYLWWFNRLKFNNWSWFGIGILYKLFLLSVDRNILSTSIHKLRIVKGCQNNFILSVKSSPGLPVLVVRLRISKNPIDIWMAVNGVCWRFKIYKKMFLLLGVVEQITFEDTVPSSCFGKNLYALLKVSLKSFPVVPHFPKI